ncbi:MAG: hypothetical protein AAFX76_03590 [Planctomycetota bacterium]
MSAAALKSVPFNLLRSANLLLLLGAGWFTWLLAAAVIEDGIANLNLWHLFYLLPLVLFAGLGFTAYTGIKSPTRSHLGLVVSLAIVVAWILATAQITSLFDWLFVEDVANNVQQVVFLPSLFAAVTVGIWIEWRLAKKIGFLSRDKSWWCEKNLRGYCVFTAWIVFLTGLGYDWSKHDLIRPESVDAPLLYLTIVLGFIALCFIIGKGVPRLLMALTGIDPAPPTPRRRRKGFHFFRSTEPIPESETKPHHHQP